MAEFDPVCIYIINALPKFLFQTPNAFSLQRISRLIYRIAVGGGTSYTYRPKLLFFDASWADLLSYINYDITYEIKDHIEQILKLR